jgi:hypothetical protein
MEAALAVGYAALACGLHLDLTAPDEPDPAGAYDWRDVDAEEGGFSAVVPDLISGSEPTGYPWARLYRADHGPSGMTFEVGTFGPDPADGEAARDQSSLLAVGLGVVYRRHGRPAPDSSEAADVTASEGAADRAAREQSYRTTKGRHVAARVEAGEGRVLVLAVISDRPITRRTKVVRYFFDSATFEPMKIWSEKVEALPAPEQPRNDLGAGAALAARGEPFVAINWTNGDTFVAVSEKGELHLFGRDGRPSSRLMAPLKGARVAAAAVTAAGKAVILSKKGRLAVVSVSDRRADVVTGQGRSWAAERGCLALAPDGGVLVIAGQGLPEMRNAETQRTQVVFGRSRPQAAAYSPDGKLIALANEDLSISLYRPPHLPGTFSKGALKGHSAPAPGGKGALAAEWALRCLEFSPDSRLLASAGNDGAARVWDVNERQQRHVFRPGGPATATAFSRDGGVLAVGTGDGAMVLYDPDDGRPLGALRRQADAPGEGAIVRGLAFDDTGDRLAVLVGDRVEVWRVGR